MDIDSRPEEVDFEGINGQILSRQAQIRIFPRFGESMSFKMAVEDYAYESLEGGYVSKCDLCCRVRRHLHATGLFDELRPEDYYAS